MLVLVLCVVQGVSETAALIVIQDHNRDLSVLLCLEAIDLIKSFAC